MFQFFSCIKIKKKKRRNSSIKFKCCPQTGKKRKHEEEDEDFLPPTPTPFEHLNDTLKIKRIRFNSESDQMDHSGLIESTCTVWVTGFLQHTLCSLFLQHSLSECGMCLSLFLQHTLRMLFLNIQFEWVWYVFVSLFLQQNRLSVCLFLQKQMDLMIKMIAKGNLGQKKRSQQVIKKSHPRNNKEEMIHPSGRNEITRKGHRKWRKKDNDQDKEE